MKHTLFTLLFSLFITGLNAQLSYTFTQYTTEQGLTQKTVSSILQDHKGSMWFATWDGINRFDGYTFQNYKAHPGDFIGLMNNRIDYIAEDKFGYIWTLSFDRCVYRFNPRTGQFQAIPYGAYQTKTLYVFPGGDVWILTNGEGLLRIQTRTEGESLMVENFSQKNDLSLIETINTIMQDSQNGQWILTNNGIYLQNPNDSLPVTFFVEIQKNKQKQPFYDMFESTEEIFFASGSGHIWVYNKRKGHFNMLKLPTESDITTVDMIAGNTLLAGTSGDGFFTYHPENKEVQPYNTTTNRSLKNNQVRKVFVDSYKQAWIQLDGKGITHFNPQTKEIAYYIGTDKYGKEIDSQPGFLIHEDIHRNLWVHPPGGGFFFYDRSIGKLVPFFNKILQSGWSSSNRLTAIFSDKQGNLWISTYNNGLEKVTFNNNAFYLYSPNIEDYDSLENDVRAMFQDKSGLLWVGSKDGYMRIYNKDKHFLGYLTASGTISPSAKHPMGMAYSIIQDREGTIWIGTKGNGLVAARPNGNAREFTLSYYKYNTWDIYSLSDDNIYCLHEDSRGRIWIATYGGGINYIERDKEGQLTFINHRNYLKNYPAGQCYRVRCVTSDDKGNVWIGSTNGLLSCKEEFDTPGKLSFNHFTRIPGDINSLSNNDVHDIYLSENNELYIATFGGGLNKLLSYQQDKARFQPFTTRNGLPSDVLLAIAEDNKGNLWLTTEEEIYKFTPRNNEVENYNRKFFPRLFKFNEGASVHLSSGEIATNTNKGFLIFNPDSIAKSSFVPNIVFSQFQLGDKIIQPGEKDSILQADIDDTPRIRLSHKNNAFAIQYAALDMKYPDNIQYAYKLEGLEENWNYVGQRRIAAYTNLPKGNYAFMVKSTNSDGIWTENTRSIAIRILPSFWETPWAILLYALALIAVILTTVYILFTFYRLKSEVLVEQKISDIKLRFFTNISHELRTPLTLIAGPIEHIMKSSTVSHEVREQLVLVEKNTNRMLRLVNQILDFRKIQNKKMKMQVQQIDMIPFIRHIMESFHSMANEHQIEFLLESSSPNLSAWVDTDKLEKIMFNLLSNAFKYTPQGKQIKVGIRENDKSFVVSVQDQGVGIPENRQKSLFVRFENLVDKNLFNQPSTGIGLSLVKELVEMHKGSITIHSKPGEGSNFSIELHKGKEHFDADTEFILTDYISDTRTVKQTWESVPQQVRDEADLSVDKETMLLVEDNPELRFFLKILFAESFNIIEAENGQDGYDKAVEHNPDIIISDVMMPVKDGIEMMKDIRADIGTSHIPVVLLTAKTSIESKLEGLEYGADDYITKPFSAAYLKARIYNLLEQRKKLQALYCANFTATRTEKAEGHLLPSPNLPGNDQKFMDTLMMLMEANMDNGELMVEDLALKLGMSRSVFFKKLKSLIGLSPIDFIKQIRIKRAAELIERREYNMAQIAYMVGFNDPHYFSKCFKQVFSMTPSEYKNNLFLR